MKQRSGMCWEEGLEEGHEHGGCRQGMVVWRMRCRHIIFGHDQIHFSAWENSVDLVGT